MFKDNLNINFSKKVMKKLLDENKDSFDNVYKRAAVVLGFMISALVIVSVYMGFNYISESFAQNTHENIVKTIQIPDNDEDLIEFSFDDNGEALLTAK